MAKENNVVFPLAQILERVTIIIDLLLLIISTGANLGGYSKPGGYWSELSNQREFLDQIGHSLGIQKV